MKDPKTKLGTEQEWKQLAPGESDPETMLALVLIAIALVPVVVMGVWITTLWL